MKKTHEAVAARIAKTLDELPDIVEGERGPSLAKRLKAVHAWAMGTERPDKLPDLPAMAIYGLRYLAETQDINPSQQSQLYMRRQYFRQVIHFCRHIDEPMEGVAKCIDKCMAALDMESKYEFLREGKEIVRAWAEDSGTLFLPLTIAVEEAIRLFMHWPGEDAIEEDVDDWVSQVEYLSGILGTQRMSVYHGRRIMRVLGCYDAHAQRHNLSKLRAWLAEISTECLFEIERPGDLDEEIKSLEIEVGQRAAYAPQRTKRRRRRR